MIKISKQNNALIVIGENNDFYINNGQNSYPLNSLIVVTDNSDMATFRSVATNDVLFSGLINNITINGEAVTKDNIIQKFDAVSNSSTGGGGGGGSTVDAYTKEEADTKFATKSELTNVQTVANDADTKVDALTTRVEGVETTLGNKQDTLVSGANIKTINNQSILGEGNIEISDYYTKTEADEIFATTTQVNHQAADIAALQTDMLTKQPTLVSGTNIKTINGESVLGEGNIEVAKITDIPSTDNLATKDELTAVETVANNADAKADAATSKVEGVETVLGNKQDTLVSGTNIKTINSQSIIGSGDLAISGVSEEQAQEIAKIPTLETEIAQKANVSDVPTVQTSTSGNVKTYVYSNPGEYLKGHRVIANLDFQNSTDGKLNLRSFPWGDNNKSSIFELPVPSATTTAAGVMSAADKVKLDSIPETIPSQSEIDGIAANVSALQTAMDGKQPTLVSGTNIKTINGNSILGEGNLVIEGGGIDLSNYYTKTETDTKLDTKQNTLISGTNIKTINSQSILGEGNIEISGGVSDEQAQEIAKIPTLETALNNKQDTLVSGTNIKTINNESLLGTGDIQISGGVKLHNIYNDNNSPLSGLWFKLKDAIPHLNDGTDYHGSWLTMNESLCKQIVDLMGTIKNGDLLGQYDTISGNIFKVIINPFVYTSSSNVFYLKLKYLYNGNNTNNVPNYSSDIILKFYFYGSSSTGEYGEVTFDIYTNAAGPTAKITDIPNTDNFATKDELTAVETTLGNKQDTLVSGTNIKTINSQSILGEGNIEVTIPDATTATSGAMSAADKTKLDSISTEWTGTQSEFDALTTKDNNTIYYVTE